MKNVFLLLLVVGLVVAGWANRDKLAGLTSTSATVDEPAEEPPAPGPSAPATPHPATEARAAATKAYPALGMKDSVFNKKFVALYAEAQREEPRLLTRPDWPLKLAERAAVALGGAPMPVAAPSTPLPAKLPGSALDQRPQPRTPP